MRKVGGNMKKQETVRRMRNMTNWKNLCAKFFQHNGTEEEVLKWVGQYDISYSMEQSPS